MTSEDFRSRFVCTYTALIMVTAGFVGMIIFEGIVDEVEVEATTLTVGQVGSGAQYNKIQYAIDNASNGDTIYVWDGTYHESVRINKTVTLIGNGSSNTTIIPQGDIVAIIILENWVNISGFSITNGFSNGLHGIFILSLKHCRIENCHISNYTNAIMINSNVGNPSSDNLISNNIFSNCTNGVTIVNSNINTITNNIYDNCGIGFSWSFSNIVYNNTMSSVGIGLSGTHVSHWNSHEIPINNTVDGKPIIYLKNIDNVIIHTNAAHIILANCTNITVRDFNFTNVGVGVELGFTNNSFITDNNCSEIGIGLYIQASSNNTITNNTCSWTDYGGIVVSDHSDYNIFENNTCISNGNNGIEVQYFCRNNQISNNTCNSNNLNGILVHGSNSNKILNNTCISNGGNSFFKNGIFIQSELTIVENNTCNSNKGDGISTRRANFNTIKNNVCDYNFNNGIQIGISDSNLIINNTCYSNNHSGIFLLGESYETQGKVGRNHSLMDNKCFFNLNNGIKLNYSDTNTIFNNSCESNINNGISLIDNSYENSIINNSCNLNKNGLFIESSPSNLIDNNRYFFNDNDGIIISSSVLNHFFNNNCSDNNNGIQLTSETSNNHIYENQISFNYNTGIQIESDCSQNRIYHNNIISNFQQAIDNAHNSWDNNFGEGNYWSDYNGIDNGSNGRIAGDGIGDTEIPHLGLDNYPFTKLSGWLFPGIPILQDPGDVDPDGNYSISWNETARSTGFIIQEDRTDTFQSPVDLYLGPSTSSNVINRTEGIYYYRVRAYNQDYQSEWSNIENITVDHLPDVPRNLRVDVYPGGNGLNISWDLNLVDTIEYDLYYKIMGDWELVDTMTHPDHSNNHSNLQDGITHYYRVQARDSWNQLSNYSEIVEAIPADSVAPAPPEGLVINVLSFESISLDWDNNTEKDVFGYNIYRSNESQPLSWGQPINGDTPINISRYIDEGLNGSTTYYYVITALDEVPNESSFSAVVSGKTLMSTRDPQVNNSIPDFEILEDTVDDTSINLYHWFKDDNDDILSFHVTGNTLINVTIFQENGTVILRPQPNWNGREELVFFASDNESEVHDDVMITVTQVNDPPGIPEIIEPKDGRMVLNGTVLDFHAVCTDPDVTYGDKLTFTWSSNISGAIGDGNYIENFLLPIGYHDIFLIVSDLNGSTSQAHVNVSVLKGLNESDGGSPYVNGDDPPEDGEDDTEDAREKRKQNIVISIIIILAIVLALMMTTLVLMKRRSSKPRIEPKTMQVKDSKVKLQKQGDGKILPEKTDEISEELDRYEERTQDEPGTEDISDASDESGDQEEPQVPPTTIPEQSDSSTHSEELFQEGSETEIETDGLDEPEEELSVRDQEEDKDVE